METLPPDSPPVRPRHYRPEIDGLRAVAVIAVWVNHLSQRLLPGGFLGVDVFFVISGYVVTSSLLGRHEHDRTGFLRHFYQRRFCRLMPALIANVVVASILFSIFVSPLDDVRVPSLRTGLAALFGVSNLYLLKQGTNYFSINTQYNIFTHTWSLGVEEQYYLFWPLVLLLCGLGPTFVRHGLRKLVVASTFLAVCSFLFYVHLSLSGKVDAAFFLMPARFWELGSGSLAFIMRSRGMKSAFARSHRFQDGVAWLGFCALIISFFIPETYRIAGPIAAVLMTNIILSATESSGSLARSLGHPLALAVGVRSYSLYLWHWPVIVLARWTWGISFLTVIPIVMATILLTLISYRLENFFRYWKTSNVLFSRPLLFYPVLAALAGGVVFLLQDPLKWLLYAGNRDDQLVAAGNMKRISGTTVNTLNCFREPVAELGRENVRDRCIARANRPVPTLYFEGDSHTEALIPLGEKIFQSGGFNVAFFARGGCPFPYFSPWEGNWHANERYRLCGPHYEARLSALRSLLHRDDSLVLVSNLEILTGMESAAQKAAENSYEGQISRISRALEPIGARVIIFAPIPSFKDRLRVSAPMTTCTSEWFRPSSALDPSCKPAFVNRSDHLRARQAVETLFARLEQRYKNVYVYHPVDALCPGLMARCSTHLGGRMLYADSHHLSNYGATMLFPSFERFMRRFPVNPFS